MKNYTLSVGPLGTNAYLLVCMQGKSAWLVDAPEGVWEEVQPILAKTGHELQGVLLTHGHWDHTQDLVTLRKHGAEIYAHEDSRPLVEDPERTQGIFTFPEVKLEPAKIDVPVKDGQKLEFCSTRCEVFAVPGHCPGSVAYYFPDEKYVFTGDVLFAGSVGRSDLPGGDWTTVEKSIREKLYTLPDEVIVYPGHGPETTIGQEKQFNPFVRQ